MEVRLVALAGEPIGRTYSLQGDDVLGRGESATLRLTHEGVSRSHARIFQSDEGYILEDVGSRNGTLLNGQVVKRSVLNLGDQIQLGAKVVLLFTSHDPAERVLQQQQRSETMSTMSAGIAHDFNNLLGVVVACLDGMRELQPNAPDPVQECVEDANRAAQQAAALARRLLTLARPGGSSARDELIDLAHLTRESLVLARRALPPTIELDVELEPRLFLQGDPTELQQVLMNLVVNARDAMPQGGPLKIRAVRSHRQIEPSPVNQWIRLDVSDGGIGMPASVRERIFEPFFTTKRRAGGNGLGLATVQSVVHGLGGHISVKSKVGEGTTFRIYLPAEDRDSQPPSEQSYVRPKLPTPSFRPPGERPRVLLVDDEPLLTRSLARLLQREAEVAVVHRGQDALQHLAQHKNVDLVLLDLRLPDMSGTEVLQTIRRTAPNLPVVICSGRVTDAESKRLKSLGAVDFLHKPVGAATLRAALRRHVVSTPDVK